MMRSIIKTIGTLAFASMILSTALADDRGGNSSGGTDPEKVRAGAIRSLIDNDGLKKAMLNYISTIEYKQIEDVEVRELLKKMMEQGRLEDDIQNSKYLPAETCRDAFGKPASASTRFESIKADICFDLNRLAKSFAGLDDENMMIHLASVAFHEHVHHFQKSSQNKGEILKNEDQANRLGGYILITAKFVQLPLLKWTRPGSGPEKFQEIEALINLIRSKERAFLAPQLSDYKDYSGYMGKTDRGIIRLLPRKKYDGKLSIRGGGAYYSFARLSHEYGYGNDLSLENGGFNVGFAGYDFGYILNLGKIPLHQINNETPGLGFLFTFKTTCSESEIRRLQEESNSFMLDGIDYSARGRKFNTGDTFAIRSINFRKSDLLVAIKVLRVDTDGSVIIAWRKLKEFRVPTCEF